MTNALTNETFSSNVASYVGYAEKFSTLLSEPMTFGVLFKLILNGLWLLLLCAGAVFLLFFVISVAYSLIRGTGNFVLHGIFGKKNWNPLNILKSMVQSTVIMLKELFAQSFISVVVFFAIIVALLAVSAFSIIGEGFESYINDSFGAEIPPDMIKVTPEEAPATSFFGIKLNVNRPEGTVLNDTYLDKIASRSDVEKIYPFMQADLPMMVKLPSFVFGAETWMDVVAVGAPYAMLKDDLGEYKSEWLNWAVGDEIPVMIPQNILDTYNDVYAEINGFPKISESLVIGASSQLIFGRSWSKEVPGYDTCDAVLCGFASQVDEIAIVIPLAVARYYNGLFGELDTSGEEYIYTYVEVTDHDAVPDVKTYIEGWGFIVDAETSLSEELQNLRDIVKTLLASMQGIILALAFIAIAFSTLIATMNRIDVYRILRLMGSSKLFISFTILLKYAVLGYVSSRFALWLVDLSSELISGGLNGVFSGFVDNGLDLTLSLSEEMKSSVVLFGTLIPALSSVPAVSRIYLKTLNRD